jgi:hypothetical protein
MRSAAYWPSSIRAGPGEQPATPRQRRAHSSQRSVHDSTIFTGNIREPCPRSPGQNCRRKDINFVIVAAEPGDAPAIITGMMPIFFFDMLDGDKFIVDEDGQELPDLSAARLESIKSARELTAFAAKEGIDVTHRVFRVRNESGEVVGTMPFREAVQPR